MNRVSIISVHGTFAGKEYLNPDEVHWNDPGSEFCQHLRGALKDLDVTFHTPTFDWGGDNLQSARYSGAVALAKKLAEYEKHGQPYHLIGHSHGGSVIWTAFRLAESYPLRKKFPNAKKKNMPVLENLVSWTTVGTPFLFTRGSVSKELFATVYQLIAVVAISLLSLYLMDHLLHWAISWTQADDLFKSWFIPIVIAVALFLCGMILKQPLNMLIQRKREGIRFRAAESHYLSRWLGITSKHDEAMNGLRMAIALKDNFLSKSAYHNLPYISPRMMMLRRCLFFPLRVARNTILLWISNWFLRKQIKSVALGDNEPLAEVKVVSTSPIDAEISELPKKIDDALQQAADDGLRKMVPQLRYSLSQAVTAAGSSHKDYAFNIPAKAFTGKELIHTSYFANPDVRCLISAHMRNPILTDDPAPRFDDCPDYASGWLTAAKNEVREALRAKPAGQFGQRLVVAAIVALLAFFWFFLVVYCPAGEGCSSVGNPVSQLMQLLGHS